MEGQAKREGSNLEELQKQVKGQEIPQGLTSHLCIWGIERFFDPKSCYKYFCKNFGEHANLTHLLKQKSKSFFVVRFSSPLSAEQFNSQFAKNKRIKAKALQEGMQLPQQQFITIEDVKRPAEKREVVATAEELQKVKNTKIEDIVQPLHALEYPEQVQRKKQDFDRVLENYNRQFFKDAQVIRRLKEGKQVKQLMLDEVIECTQKKQGYRSKSEMTIGYDLQGQVVVGFNKGSYQNNTITIQSLRNVKTISKNTKLIVALTEHFIKSNFKQLKPYDRIKQLGFWRYLIVRESQRTKQSLIMIVCKTADVDAELLAQVKQQLIEYLTKSVIGLASLCFLDYNGEADSVPTDKPQLLWGTPYYQERIFDHVFRVSPTAFLQIHLDMCEVLYSHIINAVKECDVVLDLGCGIGTIGISIRKKMPEIKVIGIQICEQAVEDARSNDSEYEVHLGRAEDKIKEICDRYRGNRIVAILDPPRAGFNKEVMVALRRCRGLDNLIYVACNAGAIQDNLLQLTLPMTEKRRAPEFLIKSTKIFDLFPQTAHYEALYILQRVQ